MSWDRSLKVGDIVTAYQSGFWRITAIEPRSAEKERYLLTDAQRQRGEEPNPLIHIEGVLTSTFKPTRRKDRCDAGYCKRVTAAEMEAECLKFQQQLRAGYDRVIAALTAAGQA